MMEHESGIALSRLIAVPPQQQPRAPPATRSRVTALHRRVERVTRE